MERLKSIQKRLIDVVECQVWSNLEGVCTEELGEAVDMIKDLSEAIYYCTITGAMNEGAEAESEKHHIAYMENKGIKEKAHTMHELEEYIQDLDEELAEMAHKWTPEEKVHLHQKVSMLVNRFK